MRMKKLYTHHSIYLLFAVCWLSYFSAYLGRLNFTACIAAINEAENLSKLELGRVSSAFFVCYGGAQLFSGLLADRLRPRLLVAVGLLGGAAVAVGVPGLVNNVKAEAVPEVPAYPYPYVELDPAYVEKLAYDGYFENGCCYGVAKAILIALREKVGYPYTVIPEEMFANGKEGYTCGTLCGALGGAVGLIGLVCASDDSRKLTKDLFAWYCSTKLPIYQPEAEAPVKTVAPSVNCVDSITTFMTAAHVARGDIIRKRRCPPYRGAAERALRLCRAAHGSR